MLKRIHFFKEVYVWGLKDIQSSKHLKWRIWKGEKQTKIIKQQFTQWYTSSKNISPTANHNRLMFHKHYIAISFIICKKYLTSTSLRDWISFSIDWITVFHCLCLFDNSDAVMTNECKMISYRSYPRPTPHYLSVLEPFATLPLKERYLDLTPYLFVC